MKLFSRFTVCKQATDKSVKSTDKPVKSRFGIRAKLQAAFAAASLMTLVAAGLAIHSYSSTETGFHRVATRDVPIMTDALRLSILSSEISTAAARLVSARTPEEQKRIIDSIGNLKAGLMRLIERLRVESNNEHSFVSVESVWKRLDPNLKALETAIVDRAQSIAALQRRVASINSVHARIGERLNAMVDNFFFDAVMAAEQVGKNAANAAALAGQIIDLRQALDAVSYSHLATSLLAEAAAATAPAILVPLQDRYRSASDHLTRSTSGLNEDLRKITVELVGFGQGAESVFALRRQEIEATQRADQIVARTASLQGELERSIGMLVSEAESAMTTDKMQLIEDLAENRVFLIIVAILSLLTAIGIGYFYVQRRLIRRLTAVSAAMQEISSGNIDVMIASLKDGDELGEMARSLEVFRSGVIERRQMAEREREEQAAQRDRGATVEMMITDFRATVTAALSTVGHDVAQMAETARSLTAIAAEADQRTRAATGATDATSTNVQSVATATEELGASIQELSQQASNATTVVARATAIATQADGLVGELSTGATRIGDIVKLIRAIADQTNLLALNATIEAARAGDAGRGFAVVASEVKMLASQTAKATEEIASQVGAIQDSTSEAVIAIRAIGEVMSEISQFTGAISAAVEEQSASTQGISRNVQDAAAGATELAGTMATVGEAIDQTNRSAASVLDATQSLAAQSGTLREAVDEFLSSVAAA